MSKTEILEELPKLSREELAEVQAKLDELMGDGWEDDGELSHTDKQALDAGIAAYERSPHDVSSWDEVEARIRAKLGL